MSKELLLHKLAEILKIPAVVGFEQAMISYLEKLCATNQLYTCERQEKLFVIKKKNSVSKRVLSIHIDRHGFVLSDIGKANYAAYVLEKKYGNSIDAEEEVFEKAATRYDKEDIYAYDAKTGKELSRGKILRGNYNFEEKFVRYAVLGLEDVPIGTPLALVSELFVRDDYFFSQIDNAVSVAVALQLIEDGFDGTVIFSTEEEIGRSWMYVEDYLIEQNMETQELLVLDTTPFGEMTPIDGGLVVLRYRDETGVFNKELVEQLVALCEREHIEYELKDKYIACVNKDLVEKGLDEKSYGHTELGRLVEHTKGKINGATVQIPSVNYHTNQELSSLISLENYYALLKALLL